GLAAIARATAVEVTLSDNRPGLLYRTEPHIAGVAAIAAATAASATATARDPIVVRHDLREELHARHQIDVLRLAEVFADRVDAQVIMPGRHVVIKSAARLRHAGDRAIETDIRGREARIGF